jgi:effector protein SdbA
MRVPYIPRKNPSNFTEFFKYIIARFIIGKLINPAQLISFDTKKRFFSYRPIDPLPEAGEEIDGLIMDRLLVDSSDGMKLGTIHFRNVENEALPPPEQKYIFLFNGRGQFAEERGRELISIAKSTGYSAISFSYRGIGTTGYIIDENDFINDGVAQINRLLEQGVLPQNIFFNGLSLGGAISTLTAKYLKDNGIEVDEFNQRSFSDLINVLVGKTTERLRGFFETVLTTFNFKMDAVKAYNGLSDDKKEFIYSKEDPTITKVGGLYKKIYPKGPNETSEERQTRRDYLNSRKFISINSRFNVHKVEQSELKLVNKEYREGETAEKFFVDYVKARIKAQEKGTFEIS